MNNSHTRPLPLQNVRIRDAFWGHEMSLIRRAVIPYQWEALNDRVPDAAPSWWVHNMRAAARAVAARRAGGRYIPRGKPEGIVTQPAEGQAPDPDAFYGWVFQDSDGYKWIEAVAYQLISQPDAVLQAQAQEAVDLICAAQEEDGYLDTFYTLNDRERAFTNLKDHHELYCFGHLTEAAVAWHQATGRDDLLRAACRFGACIARTFGPHGKQGCPGHEIAEMALMRLYEETGDAQWKDLAGFFLDVRGAAPSTFALEENDRRREKGLPDMPVEAGRYAYYQAHMPVRDMREATGHAVRQMYLCSGMADAARANGDEKLREACEALWRSTVREKMYVTGGVGGTHVGEAFSRPYDLPADTAYSETCAAIGLCFFARRMLELAPRSEYADVLERALYNTVPAGMALDGQHFFYVNPLEVDPAACESDQRLSHVKAERQKWFSCACCPPNIARIVSSLGQYIATQTDDTLYLHLYAGSRIKTRLGGGDMTLQLDADLMRGGSIALTVLEGGAQGALALRIPEWTAGESLRIPAGISRRDENGYALLTGRWRAGDRITADFPMPVRILAASPQVKEMTGQLCVARGPWVYCAEEADMGKGLHLLRLSPHARAREKEMTVAGLPLVALTLEGYRVTPEADGPLYRPWQPRAKERTHITLIPYFAWNNRGKGEMRVWLPADGQ